MAIHFSIDGQIDPVAAYAAVLSTYIAVAEFFKWRNKNAIKLTCNANMLFIPSHDKKKYVVANVVNKGETQTTITHFIGYYWPNHWNRLVHRKSKKAFIINSGNLPIVVQPGEQWMGQALQSQEIEDMALNRLLYIGVIHTMGKKEILKRIKIQKDTANSGSLP